MWVGVRGVFWECEDGECVRVEQNKRILRSATVGNRAASYMSCSRDGRFAVLTNSTNLDDN